MPSTPDALKLEIEIARAASRYATAMAADKPKLLQEMQALEGRRERAGDAVSQQDGAAALEEAIRPNS